MNQSNYYNRQIQLWGEDTQDLLTDKKIAIIGCGGLGCSVAISLGGSGIGQIDLVDFDTVGIHNIHRQIGFTINDNDKYKADVLKKLLESRSPFVKVKSFKIDFESFAKLQNDYDIIIDATDNLPVRIKIDEYCKSKQIPWIYGSVEAFHGQVCFFKNASFESVFNITNHTPEGIAPPMVINIASFQANLALRHLANLPVKKDLLYYFTFDKDGEFTQNKFKLPI